MGIKINSMEITQKKVEFNLGGKKTVKVTLTKSFTSSWVFSVLANPELTAAELVEMCDLIYSEKVLDEAEQIAIYFEKERATYICGPARVIDSILGGIKPKLPKKDVL